jgi:REP element-mobilizing transposase RayT
MLTFLATIFSIDILKYAIMDNHLHLILRNRPDLVRKWSKSKVLRRAMLLFPEKFRRRGWYVNPEDPLPRQLLNNEKLIAHMRSRMSDISWLMKVLQERIARRCNREDKMVGHFWAGRFKSERLLDEGAVLACSLYIDLNPIRANKADRPEASKYTSAFDRIRGMLARRKRKKGEAFETIPDRFLAPLDVNGDYPNEDLAEAGHRASNQGMFEMTLNIYLKLLDTVGRMLRTGKRGAIPEDLASIVERIGIRAEYFVDCVDTYSQWARQMVGAENALRQAAEKMKRSWLQGVTKASHFFIGTTANAAS